MPIVGLHRDFWEVKEVFQQPLVVLEGKGILEAHLEEGVENLESFRKVQKVSRWTWRAWRSWRTSNASEWSWNVIRIVPRWGTGLPVIWGITGPGNRESRYIKKWSSTI